jgi:RNA polymerase sigma-70 factor (ECF subfamily)
MAHGESSQGVSTRSLIRRGRSGDRSALDRLFGRIVGPVRRWAHGRLPTNARRYTDTVDVVQDAALGVWRRLDHLDVTSPGDLEAYLRQAARNRILDEARRAARTPGVEPLDSNQPAAGLLPDEMAIGDEAIRRYRTALSQLSADERACLVARIELGYSYEETALLLDKASPAAARMAVNRAHQRLIDLLKE